jgi:hypothetical protein
VKTSPIVVIFVTVFIDLLGMGTPYISAAVVMAIAGAISIHALWKARLAAGA